MPPRRGDGETILVVEDDDKVRQVTVSTLRALGFEVREAEDGDQAVAMLRSDSAVDLVFSDVKMPGEPQRHRPRARRRGRVAGDQDPSHLGLCRRRRRARAFTIIFKPYRVTELAERLHALLTSEDRSPAPEERRAARIA